MSRKVLCIYVYEMRGIIQSCENRNVQGNTNILLFIIEIFSYAGMSFVMFSIEQYNHVYFSYIPVAKVQAL